MSSTNNNSASSVEFKSSSSSVNNSSLSVPLTPNTTENILKSEIPHPADRDIQGFSRPQPKLTMSGSTVGSIMKNIEIRPRLLEENVRANMFPEVIKHVVVSMKSKIADQTLSEISTLEEINRKHNRDHTKAKVTQIRPIVVDSIVPWGILQRDATLLGSEEWTLERQHEFSAAASAEEKALTKYRVNYYTSLDGDFYYSDVVPGTQKPTQWFDFVVSRVMRKLNKFRGDDGVNEVALTKPPSQVPPPSSQSGSQK